MKNKWKKSKIINFALIIVILLGTMSYVLADRYLIEHVQITNVSAYTEHSSGDLLSKSTSVPDTLNTEPAQNLEETENESGLPTSDDWNYLSDSVSISIKMVEVGNGNDKLTYFVADVILKDSTQLQNAFAEDKFGTNIIETTSQIATANDAIFAINGDYYGFRTDGIVIRNGVLYRDIPARTGLAFYKDGSMKIYDETQTTAQELLDDGVWNTMSFGPVLVEDSQVVANLSKVEIDSNFGNHSIQGNNPRTGIGIIDNNHYIFVVVDGRSQRYSRGVSLTEFSEIFADLGCSTAYNIDGGGSSTMYFNGRVVNNPLGRNRERGTSDILFVG